MTTKACPFCGEQIQAVAIKCRFCSSNLSGTTTATTALSRYSKSDYAKYIILAVLLPIVGLIIGIVFMTKPTPEEKKMGESILAWSILLMIVWGILWFWYAPTLLTRSVIVIPSTTY